jgi:hypothetical protein
MKEGINNDPNKQQGEKNSARGGEATEALKSPSPLLTV